MDFAGFERPSFTQVPDEIFDVLMPDLSGAELKVLLYICRRTFGFGRSAAKITLDQLLNGHRNRDGAALDRGAGISSRGTLVTALKQLREQGIIVVEGPDGRAKTYSLRFRSSCPKIGQLHEEPADSAGPEIGPAAGPEIGPAQDRKSDPHKTNSSRHTDGQTENPPLPASPGDQNSDSRKVTWLTPFEDAWRAQYGGPMERGRHLKGLAAARRELGDAEALRRWRIYLAAEDGKFARGGTFASTLAQWTHPRAGRRPPVMSPASTPPQGDSHAQPGAAADPANDDRWSDLEDRGRRQAERDGLRT
ncbi:MAG: replication protein [Deltaproteobacteria bacterium]|nr:replication protein [Deltaproteobacteria bacterium]